MEAEDMKSPFEAIKQSDEAGKEWWAFIDIAELRAERQQLMSMKDWKEQLVKFLSINDHDILPDAGRISHEQAEEKALGEYEKYRVIQDQTFLSDFDRLLDDLK